MINDDDNADFEGIFFFLNIMDYDINVDDDVGGRVLEFKWGL